MYYVYRTECIPTGEFYIGCHKGIPTDGYLGSGTGLKERINKYGYTSFSKKVIRTFEDNKEAGNFELKMIQKHINEYKCLNRILASYSITEESRELMRKNNARHWKDKTLTPSHREKLSKSHRGALNGLYGADRSGSKNPMFGRSQSEEAKQAIKKGLAKYIYFVMDNEGNKEVFISLVDIFKHYNKPPFQYGKCRRRTFISGAWKGFEIVRMKMEKR